MESALTHGGESIMKTAMINLFKASLTMLVGWTFAGWMMLLLLGSLSLVS